MAPSGKIRERFAFHQKELLPMEFWWRWAKNGWRDCFDFAPELEAHKFEQQLRLMTSVRPNAGCQWRCYGWQAACQGNGLRKHCNYKYGYT
jgi:hypothetical protein